MLCPYCNAARIDNDAPCPNCGAPSPSQGRSQLGGWGPAGATSTAWGGPSMSSHASWEHPGPQLSFEESMVPPYNGASSWLPNTPGPAFAQQEQEVQSFLPVPYQGGRELQTGNSIPLQIIPQQSIDQLLPALPEPLVTVPPMYTKPRPIIPRYRVISGVISFILVSLLLCTGAGYYARTTGMLKTLRQAATGAPPANVKTNDMAAIPDPPNAEQGPASAIIPSATTASSIDPKTSIPLTPEKIFKPNQDVFLTYSVNPKGTGTVNVRWFTNDLPYKDLPIQVKTTSNGSTSMRFIFPLRGKVELYWNDQLAQRLFFVVR